MKHTRLIAALLLVSLLGSFVQAQTATRSTACNADTPNDALCVTWSAVATSTSGQAITGVTYRVQRKFGSTGTYANVATSLTTPQFYATNLAIGPHFFRVYASCTSCTAESAASNEASGAATQVPVIPSTPVIIIAATIRANGPPVYRIIQSVNLKPNEIVMVAPASMRPLFANR